MIDWKVSQFKSFADVAIEVQFEYDGEEKEIAETKVKQIILQNSAGFNFC